MHFTQLRTGHWGRSGDGTWKIPLYVVWALHPDPQFQHPYSFYITFPGILFFLVHFPQTFKIMLFDEICGTSPKMRLCFYRITPTSFTGFLFFCSVNTIISCLNVTQYIRKTRPRVSFLRIIDTILGVTLFLIQVKLPQVQLVQFSFHTHMHFCSFILAPCLL